MCPIIIVSLHPSLRIFCLSKLSLIWMKKRQNGYFRTWILFVLVKSFMIWGLTCLMNISSSQSLLRIFSLSKLPLNWMKKRQKWLFLDLNQIRYSIIFHCLGSNVANEYLIITCFIKKFLAVKFGIILNVKSPK